MNDPPAGLSRLAEQAARADEARVDQEEPAARTDDARADVEEQAAHIDHGRADDLRSVFKQVPTKRKVPYFSFEPLATHGFY